MSILQEGREQSHCGLMLQQQEWCSSQGTSSTSMLQEGREQSQSGCMMQQLGLVLPQVIRASQGHPSVSMLRKGQTAR